MEKKEKIIFQKCLHYLDRLKLKRLSRTFILIRVVVVVVEVIREHS